jgi:guanosine-3',5'-bis(diphosphate) 3'-pyrophosphohydrolase
MQENTTAQPLGDLLKALEFAAARHSTCRRKDSAATPYINHPIALATLLAVEHGISDVNVLCAAVLHDTIEDTPTTAEEIAALLNSAVADLVLEVTDNKALSKAERKQRQIDKAAQLSRNAKLIKLADFCCNLSDQLQRPPQNWPLERKQGYFDWVTQVAAGLRGTHAALETRLDALIARRDELY